MAVEHGRVEGAPDRCAMEKKQQTIRTAPWTPLCALVVRSHIYSPSLCYTIHASGEGWMSRSPPVKATCTTYTPSLFVHSSSFILHDRGLI